MTLYHQRNGQWGLDEIHWLVKHFNDRVFQLGRLQFEPCSFDLDFRIYVHRTKRDIVLLAENGLQFRRDGQFNGTNGILDTESGWTSRLVESEERIIGNPIDAGGAAVKSTIRLRKMDWEQVLRKGDQSLFVHIPDRSEHGTLSAKLCEESFSTAETFFESFFPEYRWNAFISVSWLFDRQLLDVLPATSNIVRFQSLFCLLPIPDADDAQIMDRVYGRTIVDWSEAPQETALQRAVAKHVLDGGHWRIGGAIRLRGLDPQCEA
jgi:hypothetical protein